MFLVFLGDDLAAVFLLDAAVFEEALVLGFFFFAFVEDPGISIGSILSSSTSTRLISMRRV